MSFFFIMWMTSAYLVKDAEDTRLYVIMTYYNIADSTQTKKNCKWNTVPFRIIGSPELQLKKSVLTVIHLFLQSNFVTNYSELLKKN